MSNRGFWARLRAFTLIEMLVVMVIITILAGLLLPALMYARYKSRMANCKSNLHQFGLSMAMYRTDFGDYFAPWLSTLYPTYMRGDAAYLCPNDDQRGNQGGVPDWFANPPNNAQDFTETDDTKRRDEEIASWTSPDALYEKDCRKARNPQIKFSSYMYEFGIVKCTWWGDFTKDADGYVWADFDRNGYVTWREAKLTEQKGMTGYDTAAKKIKVDPAQAYTGHVPLIRCFWHANEGKSLALEPALNLACENMNIYQSPLFGDGWKSVAGHTQGG